MNDKGWSQVALELYAESAAVWEGFGQVKVGAIHLQGPSNSNCAMGLGGNI